MKIYLAPMEGITTFIYRNAFHRYYGGIDKYFTPFLSNKSLNYKDINDVCPEHNQGLSVVPQILTNQAEVFLSIASQLADYGYQEINLNLGCPSGTVVAKKRGAGFLAVPESLDSFLEEIFDKCSQEISIKTRIGIENINEWKVLFAIYAKYPIKELIVHPRLQKEFYNGKPHPEAFQLARNSLKIPLCYNGDITSQESFEILMNQIAPIDTVMLGRGVLANPELPHMLANHTPIFSYSLTEANKTTLLENNSCPPIKMQATVTEVNASPHTPAAPKDMKTFRAFHNEILAGYIELMSGDQPVLYRMKELWVYMRNYAELSDKELKKIQKTKSVSEYKAVMQSILQ